MENKISKLESKIRSLNESYRQGEAKVSDKEYDTLLDELKKLDPENELLRKSIIEEVDENNDRMQELPMPMYSLEKIKEISELKKFVKNVWKLSSDSKIIITPKYDGISLCVNEKEQSCWTRGDGVEGQRSDDHFKAMNNGRIYLNDSLKYDNYTFGEAIFPINLFLKHKGDYKSARNCVAGLFNKIEADKMLMLAEYVRYGTNLEDTDKHIQLDQMKSAGFLNVSQYWTTTASLFNNEDDVIEEFLNKIFKETTKYKCDGLVLEVDDAKLRKALGRLPNNNPRYSIAYKNPEWSERERTIVKDIEWSTSKDGKLKPVIIFDPIDLCGATVQRATAHNANYILKHHICKNSSIIIARSGDVIPKHIETVSFKSQDMKEEIERMMICPSCGKKVYWDETRTEIVCKNPDCKERQIQNLVFFFTILGIEEFGEPTIRKIFESGFQKISDIINVTKEDLMKIEGIGKSLSSKLVNQFTTIKIEGIPFARLLTAHNVFQGLIGEKTCQLILNNLSEEDLYKVKDLECLPIDALITIPGVAETTAKVFNRGLLEYSKLPCDDINISLFQEKIVKNDNAMTIVFSGFRDKEMEKELTEKGHQISNSVSESKAKTTIVVVKDKESKSSKVEKARKFNIPIYTVEEFKSLEL